MNGGEKKSCPPECGVCRLDCLQERLSAGDDDLCRVEEGGIVDDAPRALRVTSGDSNCSSFAIGSCPLLGRVLASPTPASSFISNDSVEGVSTVNEDDSGRDDADSCRREC